MSSNFFSIKKDFQEKLALLRSKRKVAIQAFKKKAEQKKIERIKESI
jgi:hypothetical protein